MPVGICPVLAKQELLRVLNDEFTPFEYPGGVLPKVAQRLHNVYLVSLQKERTDNESAPPKLHFIDKPSSWLSWDGIKFMLGWGEYHGMIIDFETNARKFKTLYLAAKDGKHREAHLFNSFKDTFNKTVEHYVTSHYHRNWLMTLLFGPILKDDDKKAKIAELQVQEPFEVDDTPPASYLTPSVEALNFNKVKGLLELVPQAKLKYKKEEGILVATEGNPNILTTTYDTFDTTQQLVLQDIIIHPEPYKELLSGIGITNIDAKINDLKNLRRFLSERGRIDY